MQRLRAALVHDAHEGIEGISRVDVLTLAGGVGLPVVDVGDAAAGKAQGRQTGLLEQRGHGAVEQQAVPGGGVHPEGGGGHGAQGRAGLDGDAGRRLGPRRGGRRAGTGPSAARRTAAGGIRRAGAVLGWGGGTSQELGRRFTGAKYSFGSRPWSATRKLAIAARKFGVP